VRRFFIEHLDPKKKSLSITGAEAKHITKVLRMKPGDSFVLMDGKGTRCLVTVKSVGSRQVEVYLVRTLPTPPPSPVKVVLCQSLLKSRHMDYLVEKTSELGADQLIPFASRRTVVRLEANRLDDKLRHWGRIARNAAKQSGRATPLIIEPPLFFAELIARWKSEHARKIILWEEETAQDLKGLLGSPAGEFIGVVGPEGGFDPHEVQTAREAGFVPASLGHRMLRAETAAITLTAIVQFAWGDLGEAPVDTP
jgi:16S rRNA (uracil1498-N3)-methyltransferase